MLKFNKIFVKKVKIEDVDLQEINLENFGLTKDFERTKTVQETNVFIKEGFYHIVFHVLDREAYKNDPNVVQRKTYITVYN